MLATCTTPTLNYPQIVRPGLSIRHPFSLSYQDLPSRYGSKTFRAIGSGSIWFIGPPSSRCSWNRYVHCYFPLCTIWSNKLYTCIRKIAAHNERISNLVRCGRLPTIYTTMYHVISHSGLHAESALALYRLQCR